MTKKVGRNDPCPCGSGKKYKKCCFGAKDDPAFTNPANFLQSYKSIRKESRIKQCLYPDHSQCSEQIISAHSIQNNKILRKIASDGQVFMPCPKAENPFAVVTKYGRKEASVFTGFCSNHDKIVFQPIDDSDFTGTEKQIFLYIYRCFAIEYHKKQEVFRMESSIYKKRPSLINAPGFESPFKGMELAINDFKIEKEVFDEALLSGNYNVLTSFVWKFEGLSNFAGSGFEAPTTDLKGTTIQNLLDFSKTVGHIFVSVFPENDSVYAIIAWIKKYDTLFASIEEQLSQLTYEEKKCYINNTLPIISENIAINPESWSRWDKGQKDEFGSLFWGMATISEMDGHPFNRLEKSTFDLFTL
ncbi:MAG: SEC-C metal-binding domain-containing protein [Eubacteriales bacterium]